MTSPENTKQVPMNMPKEPDGYEYTGEFREPRPGEYGLAHDRRRAEAYVPGLLIGPRPILRKVLKRWRANHGEVYYSVYINGAACDDRDLGCVFDESMYAFGNYFRTPEHQKEARRRVHKTLIDYHEEIGE